MRPENRKRQPEKAEQPAAVGTGERKRLCDLPRKTCSFLGEKDTQLIPCPGHRDVEQPALFLVCPDLILGVRPNGRQGRQNPVQHIQQNHPVIFQAFAGMNGGENGTAVVLVH